jgi:hypothetical protein
MDYLEDVKTGRKKEKKKQRNKKKLQVTVMVYRMM